MKDKLPILVVIAHSSTYVPADLKKIMALTEKEIRSHSDIATDKIFHVPRAYTVKSAISRLVVDPNRAPDDIEMECQLCANGVVVSVSEEGKHIYKEAPSIESIFKRVEKYHLAFHEKIDSYHSKIKFLIDGHSMKSKGPAMKADAGKERAEIVLGNRDYTTCSRKETLIIKHFFEKKGLSVKVNDPYSGKYVLGHHCSRRKLPGIQIEFSKKLYMNENTLKVNDKKVKKLNLIIRELTEFIATEVIPQTQQ